MGTPLPPLFLVSAAPAVISPFRATLFLAQPGSLIYFPATSTISPLVRFNPRKVYLSVAGTIDHTVGSVIDCFNSSCNISDCVEVSCDVLNDIFNGIFNEVLQRIPLMGLKP